MAALTDRRKARERLMKVFQKTLDQIIPADDTVPLKGGTFGEWEDQAEGMARELLPALLEERSALETNARVEEGGRCPHCGSTKVYLEKNPRQVEVRTPHGLAVLEQQSCRCRSCDRVFSPSGS